MYADLPISKTTKGEEGKKKKIRLHRSRKT